MSHWRLIDIWSPTVYLIFVNSAQNHIKTFITVSSERERERERDVIITMMICCSLLTRNEKEGGGRRWCWNILSCPALPHVYRHNTLNTPRDISSTTTTTTTTTSTTTITRMSHFNIQLSLIQLHSAGMQCQSQQSTKKSVYFTINLSVNPN